VFISAISGYGEGLRSLSEHPLVAHEAFMRQTPSRRQPC